MNEENHFDAAAASWDSNPQLQERAAEVAEIIRPFIKKGVRTEALEFGCGTGLTSAKLYNDLDSITLIDSSQGMIRQLEKKIADNGFDRISALNMELTSSDQLDRRFNLIYTVMALHHVHDYKKLIQIFFDLLTPRGRLVIIDLVSEDGSFHEHIHDYSGHNGFDREELEAAFSAIGFRDSDYSIVYTNRKLRNGEWIEYPLFMLTAVRP